MGKVRPWTASRLVFAGFAEVQEDGAGTRLPKGLLHHGSRHRQAAFSFCAWWQQSGGRGVKGKDDQGTLQNSTEFKFRSIYYLFVKT